MTAAPADAVLLIAFGGPERPEDVRPFLDNVLRGRPVPRERYEEVVRHYEEVGGASPLNRLTAQQAAALEAHLRRAGPALPVSVGMRHWSPTIAETLAALARDGRRRVIGVLLAPHPSEASREAYVRAVEEARRRAGAGAPEVAFAGPWFDHPLFVEAVAARVAATLERLPPDRRGAAAVVFTAHSIPVGMARASSYAAHVETSARLVAARLGLAAWSVAWQSRSGGPEDPWLEPDVGDRIVALGRGGAADVVVVPIGFVSDHVEVLYDLDIAARRVAAAAGVGFHRVPTAGDHPVFIAMLASVVRDTAGAR